MIISAADDPRFRNVTLTFEPRGRERPADVFVRMVTLEENARRNRDLTPYLMTPQPDGSWQWTARLRSDLRITYQFCVSPDPLTGRDLPDRQWADLLAAGVPDPTNPIAFDLIYGNTGPGSLLELPDALPQPWHAPRPAAPAGTLHDHRLASTILADQRPVWTYLPPGGAASGQRLPLVVILDGGDWIRTKIEATFDNLIADRRIPPIVAVLVDSGPDRRTELADHPRFLRFLLEELLPWCQDRLPITDDPARTVIAGQSLGGLTATYTGLHAPHRFGRVLTQSGSFHWPKGSEFDIDAGAVIRQYVAADRVPIRIFQEAGLVEVLLLDKNRHLRDVLLAKGYDLTYREFHGGHEYASWRGGLADGLIDLLRR